MSTKFARELKSHPPKANRDSLMCKLFSRTGQGFFECRRLFLGRALCLHREHRRVYRRVSVLYSCILVRGQYPFVDGCCCGLREESQSLAEDIQSSGTIIIVDIDAELLTSGRGL